MRDPFICAMKFRKHHNNKGYRQIKRGKTHEQLKRICKKLKLPFKIPKLVDFLNDKDNNR